MWMVQWIQVVMMVEFVHVFPMSLGINVMLVQLGGMVSQAVKVRHVINILRTFLSILEYLQNVIVTRMVLLMPVVLMMLEFVHVLLMSLGINVMFAQLGGMVSPAVKVRYVMGYF